jgi:hypothetical protein
VELSHQVGLQAGGHRFDPGTLHAHGTVQLHNNGLLVGIGVVPDSDERPSKQAALVDRVLRVAAADSGREACAPGEERPGPAGTAGPSGELLTATLMEIAVPVARVMPENARDAESVSWTVAGREGPRGGRVAAAWVERQDPGSPSGVVIGAWRR